MKIDRLHIFKNELELEFDGEYKKINFFYHLKFNWHSIDSSELNSSDLNLLNKAISEDTSSVVKEKNSIYLVFKEDMVAVSIDFEKSPQKKTQDIIIKRIRRCHDRTNNAFKVKYNPLTLLLSRDSFRETLIQNINETTQEAKENSNHQSNFDSSNLALLALDIDYFKQVNDNNGHLYGDLVLKTFARRLEKTADDIKNQDSNIKIYLGHPSGEEFFILLNGNAAKQKFFEYAELFRKSISDQELPNQGELDFFKINTDNQNIKIPPPKDRGITTSIGLVYYENTLEIENSTDIASLLQEMADTSLYKAKSSGRNKVVTFESIIENCGKVIEYDRTNRICAIDIGSNVGVRLGQEFRVFSKKFSGNNYIYKTDSRSTVTLGKYPKIELTTIAVFEVQKDISFACLAENDLHEYEILPDFHLEAIPYHHLNQNYYLSNKFFNRKINSIEIGKKETLHNFITDLEKKSKLIFTAIIRIRNHKNYISKYGEILHKENLKKIYNILKKNFGDDNVYVVDMNSICIYGEDTQFNKESLENPIKEIKLEIKEIELCSGYHISDTTDKNTNSLEYSSIAASDYFQNREMLEYKDYLAAEILSEQIKQKDYKNAELNYNLYKSIGIQNRNIEEQAAYLYRAKGEHSKGLEIIENIQSEHPNELAVYGHLALYSLFCPIEKIIESLDKLNKLSDSDVDNIKASHEVGYISYGYLLASIKDNYPLHFQLERFNKIANEIIKIPKDKYANSSDKIEKVSEVLNKIQPLKQPEG